MVKTRANPRASVASVESPMMANTSIRSFPSFAIHPRQ